MLGFIEKYLEEHQKAEEDPDWTKLLYSEVSLYLVDGSCSEVKINHISRSLSILNLAPFSVLFLNNTAYLDYSCCINKPMFLFSEYSLTSWFSIVYDILKMWKRCIFLVWDSYLWVVSCSNDSLIVILSNPNLQELFIWIQWVKLIKNTCNI